MKAGRATAGPAPGVGRGSQACGDPESGTQGHAMARKNRVTNESKVWGFSQRIKAFAAS